MVKIEVFFTSELAGDDLSVSHHGSFTPGGGAPCSHWIGGFAGPRTGLDDVEKICEPTGTRTTTSRPSNP
jgi:hypothetical protein